MKVKVHEVRAVATSVAFKHNLSLSAILEATHWKCKSVFAMHYLRDVETVYDNCSTLRPLSVAGVVMDEEV